MVYVPWEEEYGICKFHAMHKTKCNHPETCRWVHPTGDEIRKIWDHHSMLEARDRSDFILPSREVDAPRHHEYGHGRAPLPPPPRGYPVAGDGYDERWHDDGRRYQIHGQPPPSPPRDARYYDYPRPHQRPWPSDLPDNSSNIHPARHHLVDEPGRYRLATSSDRRSSPLHLPHPDRLNLITDTFGSSRSPEFVARYGARDEHPPSSSFYSEPHQEYRGSSPATQASYVAPPGMDTRTGQPVGQHFDPSASDNPFINGAMIYRFVWGDPLCVRCGTTGHLPRQCKKDALPIAAQDYLYRIMRKEQNRSKAERGIDVRNSTDSLRPTPEHLSSRPSTRNGSLPPPAELLSEPAHRRSDPNERAPPPMREILQEDTRARASYWEQYNAQKKGQAGSLAQDEEDVMAMHHKQARTSDEIIDDTLPDTWMLDGTNDPRDAPEKPANDAKVEVKTKKVKTGSAAVKAEAPGGLGTIASAETSRHGQSKSTSTASRTTSTTKDPVPPDTAKGVAMGATKRMSNGEAKIIGPHPSTIRVSAPYITQSAIEKKLAPSGLDAQERSLQEAREDTARLQGVAWLDNVRRALQLPIKTYTTACIYYHKFRLVNQEEKYLLNWTEPAAASLLTSCKNEDTLKKSRDVLAAAWNMKLAVQEQIGSDDPILEQQQRSVIGVERMVLEAGGFDFRSRDPHHVLIKIGKSLRKSEDLRSVTELAWTILTDLHRTFAPLKQTSPTLALASLELAAHFKAATLPNNVCSVRDDLQTLDLKRWHTTREEVMETLLDALDLYTHHTQSTILGPKIKLDDMLRIRLELNKECSDSRLPRYTVVQPPPSPDNTNGNGSTLRVANGHPTPVSPPQPGTQVPPQQINNNIESQTTPQTNGTLRFMLDPQRATDERVEVKRHFTEEWEEYEEEIEVPVPRSHDRDRDRDHSRDQSRHRDYPPGREPRDRDRHGRDYDDRRSARDSPRGPAPDRERGPPRVRDDRAGDRDRDSDRDRPRARDRDRDGRYDDRRSTRDDYRERDRYDRRDRGREDDRRRPYYDDDRRRDRR
ncbi:hypothetical protein AC579_4026 [Pseudocercospora musae]|uniref:CCHC-type domain-containing protein n=1 Tax=Pseudocercospora musae TaxID=113226 RepID=A0A139I2S0_9PEZI|nr:hypothetical protein AC579_4026 [Pseudocercospora musae]